VAARFISAKNSPARKAASGKPLLIVILLCAGRRFAPPKGCFGTVRESDQVEKKLSHKLNMLTGQKRRNSVIASTESCFFRFLQSIPLRSIARIAGKAWLYGPGFAGTKNPPLGTRRVILSELGRA
jgi:hypothetical protein